MNPFILDIISITWPLIIVLFLFSYLHIKELIINYRRIIEELNND